MGSAEFQIAGCECVHGFWAYLERPKVPVFGHKAFDEVRVVVREGRLSALGRVETGPQAVSARATGRGQRRILLMRMRTRTCPPMHLGCDPRSGL